MEKKPITRTGYNRLYWQLMYLRRNARREVAGNLADAREGGLSSRNLEWRTAREKQAWLEMRIRDLEDKINNCEVVLTNYAYTDRADFGLMIKVRCADENQVYHFKLVGPFESDVSQGLLSIDSPAGKAIVGRRKGEYVTFMSPTGLRTFQVLEIYPGEPDPSRKPAALLEIA